jgi:hypothetical protein
MAPPFAVTATLLLSFWRVNIIAGSSSGDAGVCCRGSSNVTFQAIFSVALTAIGSRYGPSIGSSAKDACDVLRFAKRSYDASASENVSAGIGSVFVLCGQSMVNAIVFSAGM